MHLFFQDLRKKGSANKLSKINQSLNGTQKKRIASVGFGDLLEIKCNSVPEKLSLWLINDFNINKSELAIPYIWLINDFNINKSDLAIPYIGTIKVDNHAVKQVLDLPMGATLIDYEKESYSETFIQFYKVFGHENDQNAQTFVEVEKQLFGEGRSQQMTNG